MKLLHYDGVAFLTSAEVADAVLELATAVARFRRYETVTIPVVAHGRTEGLTLVLGPTMPLSALSTPSDGDGELDGAAEAAQRLRDRTRMIAEPPGLLDGELDALIKQSR